MLSSVKGKSDSLFHIFSVQNYFFYILKPEIIFFHNINKIPTLVTDERKLHPCIASDVQEQSLNSLLYLFIQIGVKKCLM